MNKANDMQTKKVFSLVKYLYEVMKECNDSVIQNVIVPTIKRGGWAWKCDGKTVQECHDMHFAVLDDWCIEIPQNENIDFWRNCSN